MGAPMGNKNAAGKRGGVKRTTSGGKPNFGKYFKTYKPKQKSIQTKGKTPKGYTYGY